MIRAILEAWAPAFVAAAFTGLALALASWWLLGRHRDLGEEAKLPRQLFLLAASVVGVGAVVLALPLGESVRNQLLGLLGLVLTGVFAVSSTSFVSNVMAGWMLRTVGSFRPGDFVRVEQHFGRVTERGLFHTEIQTEDRDLTTLPNLFLAGHPVTVVRRSGTRVSATVSLGYDVHHDTIEDLLCGAARSAGLEDPFVHVVELGDFAVTYRVAGMLEDVRGLLTTRSNLRRAMLDALHGGGVEIVSPTFMNQRPIPTDEAVLPTAPSARPLPRGVRDDKIFDKAVAADRLEQLRTARAELRDEIGELEGRRAEAADREAIDRELERRRAHLAAMDRALEVRSEAMEEED